MRAILGQCHLITCCRGQWPTRHRLWDRLGDTGGFWGSTQDFKHHCCMLLVPAKEMRTANLHALLPQPQRVFLGLLNRKLVHRSAVQHPVYEIVNPTPVILPDELQCFGTVGKGRTEEWTCPLPHGMARRSPSGPGLLSADKG